MQEPAMSLHWPRESNMEKTEQDTHNALVKALREIHTEMRDPRWLRTMAALHTGCVSAMFNDIADIMQGAKDKAGAALALTETD